MRLKIPPLLFLPAASLSFLLTASHFFALVIVLTDSMEPAVPRGSLAVVAKFGDWQVGDIVLYRAFGALILHRVIEEKNGMFRTKGDAAQSWDPWLIPRESIIGKVVLIIPLLGKILLILREPLVFAATVTSIYLSSVAISARRDLSEALRRTCEKTSGGLKPHNGIVLEKQAPE